MWTMDHSTVVPEQPPLQDIDLLQRLTRYFDELDLRLRQGQGWVIFNASGSRAGRINRFLLDHVQTANTPFSHYFLPWRDFALTSYLIQNELHGNLGDSVDGSSAIPGDEYRIAASVSRQTLARMATSDLLVLSGLTPRHGHEIRYLEDTIERRHRFRLATILITPDQPHELAIEVAHASGEVDAWTRLSGRLFETSLVAM